MITFGYAVAAAMLLVVCVSAVALLVSWMGAFADLLWMFARRQMLVGGVTAAVFALTFLIFGLLLPLDRLFITATGAALLITPLVARPLSNLLAWIILRDRRDIAIGAPDPTGKGDTLPSRKTFLFDLARGEIRNAYEAPPVER